MTISQIKVYAGPGSGSGVNPESMKPRVQEIATYGAVNSTTPPFLKNGLVTLNAGRVVGMNATAAIALATIWGMSPAASRGIAGSASRLDLTPPAAMNGDFVNAFDLRGCFLEVSAAGVTTSFDSTLVTGGALTNALLPPGTQIALSQQGTGIYAGLILLSTSGTKVGEVIRPHPVNPLSTEVNPRVVIRLFDGALIA